MSDFMKREEIDKIGREQYPRKPFAKALETLNYNQELGVMSSAKNTRLIAGPGTGKTYTMLVRIAKLIEDGVDPRRILATSFTNESANELSNRVSDQCGYDGNLTNISTMHSLFNLLLRYNSKSEFFQKNLGYTDGFFIIDQDEANKLMDEAIKSMPSEIQAILKSVGMDRKHITKQLTHHRSNCLNAPLLSKTIMNKNPEYKLSSWKELMNIGLDGVDDPESITTTVRGKLNEQAFLSKMLVVRVWQAYSNLCKKNHALDFDDVLLNSYFLLKFNPDIAKTYAARFDHFLVDEFQDSNNVQLGILQELGKANPDLNFFIVGDPRQSIYGFREANVENMLDIAQKMQQEFTTYELVHNYRSTPKVVNITNTFANEMEGQATTGQLIAGNANLQTAESSCTFARLKDADTEASFISDKVDGLLQSGVEPDDIYIMYRARSAIKVLEPLLKEKNTPYEMIGEINFYERAEVRDTMAFLRATLRPNDTLAWARTLDCIKIGATGTLLRSKSKEIEGLLPRDFLLSRKNVRNKAAIDNFIDFYDATKDFFRNPDFEAGYAQEMYPKEKPEHVFAAIDRDPKVKAHFNAWKAKDAKELIETVCESWVEFVKPAYTKADITWAKNKEDADPEERTEERLSSIKTLLNEVEKRMVRGDKFEDIVEDLMLRDTPTRKDRAGTVKLLTGHASKGLEAKYVFMVGCDESIWNPSKKEDEKEHSENGRLYYVMTTRAECHLYAMSAEGRTINGEWTKAPACTQYMEHLDYIKDAGLLDEISIIDEVGDLKKYLPKQNNYNRNKQGGYQNARNNYQNNPASEKPKPIPAATNNPLAEKLLRTSREKEINPIDVEEENKTSMAPF